MSATPELSTLLRELRAESAELDALVAELDDEAWRTPTPADGWTIAHQIAHLASTDEIAYLAITDPPAFRAGIAAAADRAARGAADGTGGEAGSFIDVAAADGAGTPPAELLDRWRTGRSTLGAALNATVPGQRIEWFGPPMSPMSMVTARLMETWAHGFDVADALGVAPEPTPRLRHVAHLAVRAMPYAFAMNGRDEPVEPIRVELTAADGELWTWGPTDAAERVTGSALDFCLRMTQRRHRDDLALVATGSTADTWLDIGQAFAGPPGSGRTAGRTEQGRNEQMSRVST